MQPSACVKLNNLLKWHTSLPPEDSKKTEEQQPNTQLGTYISSPQILSCDCHCVPDDKSSQLCDQRHEGRRVSRGWFDTDWCYWLTAEKFSRLLIKHRVYWVMEWTIMKHDTGLTHIGFYWCLWQVEYGNLPVCVYFSSLCMDTHKHI